MINPTSPTLLEQYFPRMTVLCVAMATAFVALLSIGSNANGVDDARGDSLRQNEQQQQNVRDNLKSLVEQWNALLDEYLRNGLIQVKDRESVERLRSVVTALNEKELCQVVELLQKSRDSSQPEHNLSEARRTQEIVSERLKALVLEFERNQARAAINDKLAELAQRQADLLKNELQLQRAMEKGVAPESKQKLDGQHANQEAITADLKETLATMTDWKNSSDTPADTRQKLEYLTDKARAAVSPLESATAATKNNQLAEAVDQGLLARSALRDIANAANPGSPPSQSANELKEALDKLNSLQNSLSDLIKNQQNQASNAARDQKAQDKRIADLQEQAKDIRGAIDNKPATDALQSACRNLEVASKATAQAANSQNFQMAQIAEQSAQSFLTEAQKALQEEAARVTAQAKQDEKNTEPMDSQSSKENMAGNQDKDSSASDPSVSGSSSDSQKQKSDSSGSSSDSKLSGGRPTESEKSSATDQDEKSADSANGTSKSDKGKKEKPPEAPDMFNKLIEAEKALQDETAKEISKTKNQPENKLPVSMAAKQQQIRQDTIKFSHISSDQNILTPFTEAAEAMKKAATFLSQSAFVAANISEQKALDELNKALKAFNTPLASKDQSPPPKNQGSGEGGGNGSVQLGAVVARQSSTLKDVNTGTGKEGTNINLPPKDRAIIEQSQAEKYPAEYGGMVEQYMRNLSENP